MTSRSVSQLAPKLFRLAPAQFSTDWFIFSEVRGPVHLARFVWRGGQKFREQLAVPRDGDLLAMLDPFGQAGEIVSQVSHRCCLHRDTAVSHAAGHRQWGKPTGWKFFVTPTAA